METTNRHVQNPILKTMTDWSSELTAIRHDFHRQPETAFQEVRTASIIAAKLRSWGLEVHEGIAGTGVVGVVSGTMPGRSIGLRADMDALDVLELNAFAHRSEIPGKMHACGHDGHSTMLLAAARYLALHPPRTGRVVFIFQPAEENEGGARSMIEAGLFERFPVDEIFGMHNMPGIAVGSFALKPGAMMAGFDVFDIVVSGTGGHAGIPHHAIDPVVVAAQTIIALQTMVSRRTDPTDAIVLSVTQIHAGTAYNIIPERAEIGGTVRYLSPPVRDRLMVEIEALVQNLAAGFGATAELRYQQRYPPTINAPGPTALSAKVLAKLAGEAKVDRDPQPLMGSEDFAFMLQQVPGCYIFAGNGDEPGSCMIHNPRYDFNDALLPIGGTYWVELAREYLDGETIE